MKVGLTLEQLGQELVCQSEVKQDYLVSSDKMMMETYGGIPVLRVLDSAGEDCMEPLELNSTAHRQLSGYLRIPANYYERMLKEYPELLVHNVNSWLSRTQEVKMLRTLDGAGCVQAETAASGVPGETVRNFPGGACRDVSGKIYVCNRGPNTVSAWRLSESVPQALRGLAATTKKA